MRDIALAKRPRSLLAQGLVDRHEHRAQRQREHDGGAHADPHPCSAQVLPVRTR